MCTEARGNPANFALVLAQGSFCVAEMVRSKSLKV